MRRGPKEGFALKVKETTLEILNFLAISNDSDFERVCRIAYWNRTFPDIHLSHDADLVEHFINIVRRHLIGSTTADRFCFELSVHFIGVEPAITKLCNLLPCPYATALKISYRCVIGSLESPSGKSMERFYELMKSHCNPDVISTFSLSFERYITKAITLSIFLEQVKNFLPRVCFSALIESLASHQWLGYAFKYKTPPPRLLLDISKLTLSFEYLQAIADIEGIEYVTKIIDKDRISAPLAH